MARVANPGAGRRRVQGDASFNPRPYVSGTIYPNSFSIFPNPDLSPGIIGVHFFCYVFNDLAVIFPYDAIQTIKTKLLTVIKVRTTGVESRCIGFQFP